MTGSRARRAAAAVLALAAGLCAAPWTCAWAQDGDAAGQAAFRVYVPGTMMAGVGYEGVVVRYGAGDDHPVHLATTDRGVSLPASVTFEPGRSHAIFPVSVDDGAPGRVRITAVLHGEVQEAVSEVHGGGGVPTHVMLVAPNAADGVLKTASRHPVPLYAYLTDQYGVPAAAAEDTVIRLSATTEAVGVTAVGREVAGVYELAVPAGGYGGAVRLAAGGSGTVYGVADGLERGTLRVERAGSGIDVRVEVAPEAALPNSYVHYFVWLERDGAVYAPETVEPALVSVPVDGLLFTDPGRQETDARIYLHDGMAHGRLYTGHVGKLGSEPGAVSVVVDGIGSDTDGFLVGVYDPGGAILPREVVDACYDDGDGDACSEVALVDLPDAPDAAHLWVYPDTPDGRAHGAIGTYAVIDGGGDADADADADAGAVPRILFEDGGAVAVAAPDDDDGDDGGFALVPVSPFGLDGFRITGGGGALDYPDRVLVPHEKHGLPGSLLFEIGIHAAGGYELAAASDHTYTAIAAFEAAEGYDAGHSVVVTQLPAAAGEEGSVAVIALVDAAGNLADVGSPPGVAHVTHVGGPAGALSTTLEAGDWEGPTAVLSGTHTGHGGRIAVQIPGIESEASYTVSPAGVPAGIDVWTPPEVRVSEEFPLAVHITDSDGNPLGLAAPGHLTNPTRNVAVTSHGGTARMVAAEAGSIDLTLLAAGGHIDRHELRAFRSTPGHVSVSAPGAAAGEDGGLVRLGTELLLDVLTGDMVDPHVDIAADGLRFDGSGGGRYVAVPESPGRYDVVVTVTADGWETYSGSVTYQVERRVDVTYAVSADDGAVIPAPLVLRHVGAGGGNHTLYGGSGAAVRPGIYELEVSGDVALGDDRIYQPAEFRVNGDPTTYAGGTLNLAGDTDFELGFERHIEVDFVAEVRGGEPGPWDVEGSGRHAYGEAVLLEAPRITEHFGLVWLVPAEWEGLPEAAAIGGGGGTAAWTATGSAYGAVVYERSYVPVLALAGAAACAVPVLAWRGGWLRRAFSRPAPSLKARRGGAAGGAA